MAFTVLFLQLMQFSLALGLVHWGHPYVAVTLMLIHIRYTKTGD
jgi:hypothetical protein